MFALESLAFAAEAASNKSWLVGSAAKAAFAELAATNASDAAVETAALVSLA